jgi:hypothetical protein
MQNPVRSCRHFQDVWLQIILSLEIVSLIYLVKCFKFIRTVADLLLELSIVFLLLLSMKIGDICIQRTDYFECLIRFSFLVDLRICDSQFFDAGCIDRFIPLSSIDLEAASNDPSYYLRVTSTLFSLGFFEKFYCSIVSAFAHLVYSPFNIVVRIIVGVAIGF